MQEKYYGGRRLFIVLPIVTFLMGVLFTVPSLADGIHPQESNSGDVSDRSRLTSAPEMSYQALLKWLEEYQDAKPTFQPGQRLTAADQEALKPFIPLPAWEFYFYPGDGHGECRPPALILLPKTGERIWTRSMT